MKSDANAARMKPTLYGQQLLKMDCDRAETDATYAFDIQMVETTA